MRWSWKWLLAIPGILVLGLATLGFTTAVRHGMHHEGFGFFGERGMAELEVRLKLSPDQSKQIREILKNAREKGFDQFAAGSNDRVALAKAVFDPNPNQAEIQKDTQAVQQQHQQMLQLLVDTGAQISKVLTPEQRVEMQKIIEEKAAIAGKMRDKIHEHLRDHDER